MAEGILILGKSGSGKTASLVPNEKRDIKGLDPKKTFLISVTNKKPTFKGSDKSYTLFSKENPKGNYYHTGDTNVIVNVIQHVVKTRPEIKNFVIDDFHYAMVEEFMGNINERGYDKYNNLAKNMYTLIRLKDVLPADKYIIYIGHVEVENNETKLKTVGKLVDKFVPEGYFSYVFNTLTETDEQGFMKFGFYTKPHVSPLTGVMINSKCNDVFEDLVIKNDIGYVIDEIEKFKNGDLAENDN